MSLNHLRIGALCMVTAIGPSLLSAQMGGQQPGGGAPTQPNQMPGTLPGGGGMAGAMTGESGTNDPASEKMRDAAFLHKAAEGGMAEVQLGQLASQKAGSEEVKQFGQKMVTDHTALNQQMKPIADQMGVREPTKLNKKDQAEYDKLNGMSGNAFDQEYLAYMVKDHHQDLKDFKSEAEMTSDAALKPAVQKGLLVIQQHTQMVDKLAQDKGVPVPGGSKRAQVETPATDSIHTMTR